MGKKINIDIKNKQLAEALNLGSLREKLAKRTSAPKEEEPKEEKEEPKKKAPVKKKVSEVKAEPKKEEAKKEEVAELLPETHEGDASQEAPRRVKARSTSAFAEGEVRPKHAVEHEEEIPAPSQPEVPVSAPMPKPAGAPTPVKLGPTGRHIDDLKRKPAPPQPEVKKTPPPPREAPKPESRSRPPQQEPRVEAAAPAIEDEDAKNKGAKVKDFRDFKPAKKQEAVRSFDSRDRQGLREVEDDQQRWRKRRAPKQKRQTEDLTIRPSTLAVRVPIAVKDLAQEMKLKATQIIQKLFMHGVVVTLNDLLEDPTTIELIGHEFNCAITIDTSEEERIRITDKTIKQEIAETDPSLLVLRAPIVTFMGHVDHGKTSLIDAIRKSNRVAGEAGAITQHIGAFRCITPVGDITILDTPGHEAFSAMRERGADATDIVVLVVAGDEGIRTQTVEALQQAKTAEVSIIVAINKSDKPNFNQDNIYRELAEKELLPEAWGGQTITVNTSAVTGAGIDQLLEMLALQAEVMELRANPKARARGTVLESEMHKGMGMVATVLIQNGTLRIGDAVVFGKHWGRIKTIQNEHGVNLSEASPSTPVEITGLSGLPEAGDEFIVVANEKEARSIAETRASDAKAGTQIRKAVSMDTLMQEAKDGEKKVLHVILRADVQGAVEALKTALSKIKSDKVDLNIVAIGVGEITESDVQLAAASKTVIVGFHTGIESNAADLAKQFGVRIILHDVIYHAIDEVKAVMTSLLDKIAIQNEMGALEVRAIFKSSQVGAIAGCMVTDGFVQRTHQIRVVREGAVIADTTLHSLKRVKEDVREVQKGVECGVVLKGFKDVKEGDILQAYEVSYMSQEL